MNKKGNPNISKYASAGGKAVLAKRGSAHFVKLGKRGRRKQLKAAE